jgi:hypothetical protein
VAGPAILVDLADKIPGGRVFADRMLTDPRAESVWYEVRRRSGMGIDAHGIVEFRRRVFAVDPMARVETWWPDCPRTFPEDDPASDKTFLADRACAALFLACAVELAVSNKPVPISRIEQEAARWRAGAALCSEALVVPMGFVVSEQDGEALARAASIFTRHAKFLESAKAGDKVVSRSRTRAGAGDDARRMQVRSLARTTVKLFGSPLVGTLATLINVARDLPEEERVTRKDAEIWTRGFSAPPK